MDNYISCTLSSSPGKAPTVIFPNGKTQQFHQPIKAAELMLEKPNFFLVNSLSLQIGRRFSALNADEDLETSNVYLMFPMKRFNSVINSADLGPLFLAANKVSAAAAGGILRVAPEPEKEEEDDVEDSLGAEFMKRRLSVCRSRKPLLERIVEEPVWSRFQNSKSPHSDEVLTVTGNRMFNMQLQLKSHLQHVEI
ncbi:hypothetical protein ACSBR1_023527 [Camellia fascicularis]